jgi:hypothetical protein
MQWSPGGIADVLARPSVLVGLAVVVGLSAFQFWISPGNPPGFMRDEAALAYNAYTIGHQGRDEDGARFPLYFRSFDDYKSRSSSMRSPGCSA